jgi:hypothetical protein
MRKPVTLNTLTSPISTKLGEWEVPISPATPSELGALAPSERTHAFDEKWHSHIVECLIDNIPCYVTGGPGRGKDYTIEAIAWATGRPLLKVSVKPDMDASDLVARVALKGDGVGGVDSKIEEGALARAVKGVEVVRGGKKIVVPPIILVSDADRLRDWEVFRQSIEVAEDRRYLTCPVTGEPVSLARGTWFAFTGNSALDGDGGKGMSVNPIDASIANRLFAVYAPAPSLAWEQSLMGTIAPHWDKAMVALVVKCLRGVRDALEGALLIGDISARNMEQIAPRIDRRLARGDSREEAIRESFYGMQSWYSNPSNREIIKGALDPHIGSAP